jgi:cytoskeletal protein CcmA (bactofilin family)
MFNRKESSNPDVFDTLVGVNSVFEGNIETDGTIRIDGRVNGNLRINGDVYVGKDAVITGNIYANNIFLSGKVEGNIESKGTLRALSTAKLYGDILVVSLITEDGSQFEGTCKMCEHTAQDEVSAKSNSKKSRSHKNSSPSIVEQIYDQKEKQVESKTS